MNAATGELKHPAKLFLKRLKEEQWIFVAKAQEISNEFLLDEWIDSVFVARHFLASLLFLTSIACVEVSLQDKWSCPKTGGLISIYSVWIRFSDAPSAFGSQVLGAQLQTP